MNGNVRFLHVADLHLGAPVRGLRGVDAEWAARLQRAIPEAYERVIDAALAHEVDFVVLAGDAFDTSRPSYGDYLRFFAGLERLDAAGIPVYLIAGNHDPYTTWGRDVERLPGSARLLGASGPEFALYERGGEPVCIVGGRSYFNQSWPADESVAAGISRDAAEAALGPRASEAPFMVGVLHTGLDIDLGKAPVQVEELLGRGVDYWACGHLHRAMVLPSEREPRVVFSGCVQGRDVKETGERGCFLVEVRKGARAGCGASALTQDVRRLRRLGERKLAPTHSEASGLTQGELPIGAQGELPAVTQREASGLTQGELPGRTQGESSGLTQGELPAVTRGGDVALEFLPTSSVVFERVGVDVGDCQTLADVVRLVEAQLFRVNGEVFSDEMVVRVELEGETGLHGFLRREDIREDLRKHINNAYPSFFCDSLVDRTWWGPAPEAPGASGSSPLHIGGQPHQDGGAGAGQVAGQPHQDGGAGAGQVAGQPHQDEGAGAARVAGQPRWDGGAGAGQVRRGVFAEVVGEMAEEQRGREDVLINYVQSEFVRRGIAVPAALSRRVGEFNDSAERLVLDLLRGDDEAGA